jgi:hypothetical protein
MSHIFIFSLVSGVWNKSTSNVLIEALLDTHMREHSSKQHIQRYIYTREEEARDDDDDDEGRRRLRRQEKARWVQKQHRQECLDNAKCDEKELRRARLYKGTEEGEGGGSFRTGRGELGAY